MTLADMYHALEAVRSAKVELQELEAEHEWFCSDSLDQLNSAEELLVSEINQEKNNNV